MKQRTAIHASRSGRANGHGSNVLASDNPSAVCHLKRCARAGRACRTALARCRHSTGLRAKVALSSSYSRAARAAFASRMCCDLSSRTQQHRGRGQNQTAKARKRLARIKRIRTASDSPVNNRGAGTSLAANRRPQGRHDAGRSMSPAERSRIGYRQAPDASPSGGFGHVQNQIKCGRRTRRFRPAPALPVDRVKGSNTAWRGSRFRLRHLLFQRDIPRRFAHHIFEAGGCVPQAFLRRPALDLHGSAQKAEGHTDPQKAAAAFGPSMPQTVHRRDQRQHHAQCALNRCLATGLPSIAQAVAAAPASDQIPRSRGPVPTL